LRLKQAIEEGLASGPAEAADFAEIAREARAKWEGENRPPAAIKAAE
jgi:hypothetical protein